jgi:hydrogenase maturation factor
MDSIPIGKLPAELLKDLLDRYSASDPRVIVGPGIGEDATVIDMGDRYLVAKTDPVTFATDEIGSYAVHVNANDVACCGATPRWFLATLLLPEHGTTAELAETILDQIARACRQLGVSLCGGHTEIMSGLPRPVVVGQMLGEVNPGDQVTTGRAQAGDTLLLTKGFAIEGTAIIAREKQDELRSTFSDADLRCCADLLHEPGISVVADAQIALQVGGVHALHDPTEGGLATGLWELAQAACVGLVVEQQRLPLLPECQTLCQHYGLDPLGLIASGSLLIAAEPTQAEPIVEQLRSHGIAAAVIGQVVPHEEGCRLRSADGSLHALPTFVRDEITRLF